MLGRYKYVSGAQEKVARVFGAPKAFYDSFTHISNVKTDDTKLIEALPLGATVPVLGLSNKAVYEGMKKFFLKNRTSVLYIIYFTFLGSVFFFQRILRVGTRRKRRKVNQ